MDELKYSFLTTYKRLHFLIRIFHINPEDMFSANQIPFDMVIKNAFNSQFTARKSLFSGANIYRWKAIK